MKRENLYKIMYTALSSGTFFLYNKYIAYYMTIRDHEL
jgi:hypothetical protein